MTTRHIPASEDGESMRLTGVLPARLANVVSDAISAAIKSGMEPDEATCVAVAVVADYGRMHYGNGYLDILSGALLSRANEPPPAQKEQDQ